MQCGVLRHFDHRHAIAFNKRHAPRVHVSLTTASIFLIINIESDAGATPSLHETVRAPLSPATEAKKVQSRRKGTRSLKVGSNLAPRSSRPTLTVNHG